MVSNIKKQFSRVVTKYGVYILLCLAFVPTLIHVFVKAYGPVENYGWNILYYHVGYETGFGGRKLLATICHFFFPDFVQLRHIRMLVIIVNIIMVALFVLFVCRCFNGKNNHALWTITALYTIGPFSLISFMTTGLSVAFTETYQIALTLLWLLLWVKYRGRWPFYLATLGITVICCLIHHTFCCTLFPLYAGLFIYDIVGTKQIHTNNLVGYGGICFLMLVLLIVIWQFSRMTIDIDQLNAWLEEHAAVNAYECSREAHDSYYYMSNSENRANMAPFFTWRVRYGELFWTILLLSPLLFSVYYPWVRASRTAPTKLAAWRYRMVWILITALTLPVFFMATDYSRWFICYFFGMFVTTVSVITIGDRPLRCSILRMFRWFTKHPVISVALIIYLVSLHCTPFDQTISQFGLQEAVDLWNFIKGAIA